MEGGGEEEERPSSAMAPGIGVGIVEIGRGDRKMTALDSHGGAKPAAGRPFASEQSFASAWLASLARSTGACPPVARPAALWSCVRTAPEWRV
jgi:hypothetical protein